MSWQTRRTSQRLPSATTAAPTQRQQTITVWNVARPTRLFLIRQFPKQELEPAGIKTIGPSPQTWGFFDRALGPFAPQLILPLPTLAQQTLGVYLSVRQALIGNRHRKFTSRLAPPAVVEPYLRANDYRLVIQETLAAVAQRVTGQQRQPHFKLLRPQVLFLPPPLVVACTATRDRLARIRRTPIYRVEAPTTLQVFAGPATHLVHTRPRPQAAELKPPAVVNPPVSAAFYGPQVTLASLKRRALQRPAQTELRTGVTEPALLGSDPRLRVTTKLVNRADRVRREPFTRLGVGVTEPALLGSDPRLTIRTVLQLQNRLERVRKPVYRLQPPTIVLAAPFIASPVGVTVATLRRLARRPAQYKLRAGIAEPSLLGSDPRLTIRVKQVRTRPRPQAAELRPPTAITPLPSQRQQTITTRLARIRPPRYNADIRPPTALQVFAGPTVTLAVKHRATYQRRGPHSFLRPFIFKPQTGVLRVWLAVQNRLSRFRRRPAYKLQKPTATFTVVAAPTETDFTQADTASGRVRTVTGTGSGLTSGGTGRTRSPITGRGNQADTGRGRTNVDT